MNRWRHIELMEQPKIHKDKKGDIYFVSSIYGWNYKDKSDMEELVELRYQLGNLRNPEIKVLPALNYDGLVNDQRIMEILERAQINIESEIQILIDKGEI